MFISPYLCVGIFDLRGWRGGWWITISMLIMCACFSFYVFLFLLYKSTWCKYDHNIISLIGNCSDSREALLWFGYDMPLQSPQAKDNRLEEMRLSGGPQVTGAVTGAYGRTQIPSLPSALLPGW